MTAFFTLCSFSGPAFGAPQAEGRPSLEALEAALESAKVDANDSTLLRALNALAAAQVAAGQAESAALLFGEARTVAERLGTVEAQIEALRNAARIHRQLSDFELAIEQLSAALGLAQGLSNPAQKNQLLQDIGKVYAGAGDALHACDFFEKALIGMEDAGASGRFRVLIDLALVQTKLGEIEEALYSYEVALELAQAALAGPDALSATLCAGMAHLALSNYDQAVQVLQAAARTLRGQGDQTSLPAALVLLGVAYEYVPDLQQAAASFEEASTLARLDKTPGIQIEALLSLAQTHVSFGSFKQAFQLATEALELEQARQSQDQESALAEFMVRYESRERELEIEALGDEKAIKQERLLYSRTERRRLALIMFGVVLSAGVLAWSTLGRKRAHDQLRRSSSELSVNRDELKQALAHVESLRGLLPICSHCKSIRNEAGRWNELETYISNRSSATISNVVCPACKAAEFRRV